MRILTSAIVLFAACACGAPSTHGPAVRLSSGLSDTIIVNNRRPTPLPVWAVDAAGRTVTGAPIRYEWLDGAPLPVTSTGAVTCTQSGDFAVRADLGGLTARVFVRCRPVEYVRFPGPVQFIINDSQMSRPRKLPVSTYGPDGRPVALFAGGARVEDSSVAALHGLTVYPRTRGITMAGVAIGDRSAAIGLHIYQRVGTLAALDTILRVRPQQRLFAVPLRLESGELHRQRLPPGGWMLTMLPENGDHDSSGIRLRVEGATCQANLLNTPRRFGCSAGSDAAVVVYRAFRSRDASVATGDLLVRSLF
ncbi:MAG: hypothetical protein M3466_16210 [Gemmatimonadota bacterium]|nr:hypothetical protein [Gemmatimonadota bacterium]